jgi:small subunit ribosomal protein S8
MHYDLLAKIKNAGMAKKDTVFTPYSNLNFAIAQVLLNAKFLKDVQKKVSNRKGFLDIKIAYHNGKPAMTDFKLVSRPGRRVYIGYKDLSSVRQNFGIGVLSTPRGVMDNKQARKTKVGGEYLFQIW